MTKNKIFITLTVLLLVFLVFNPVFAQTSDFAARIESLQNQIRALQEQLKHLQASQRVGNTATSFDTNLYFGLKHNDNVTDLQEFLTDQGYYAGPVNGNFGLLTLQASKKFQSINGLRPTGFWGAQSRGIANGILKKIIGTICISEKDCPDNVLPPEKLPIITDSDLRGTVGENFAATFKVSGGSGNYKISDDGKIPSGLSFTFSSDSATLSGLPAQAGIFNFVIFANDLAAAGSAVYGKESFTTVIKERVTAGNGPVISGIKGPIALKVGEIGIWTINASDSSGGSFYGGGSLSYSVIWGDETNVTGAGLLPSAHYFLQTATFSHVYQSPGVYRPSFRVVNDQGLEARSSISVDVTAVINHSGTLQISPANPSINIGKTVELQAIYQPPMPPCPTSLNCILALPGPYPVRATWTSSNPKVAIVAYKDTCPPGANCLLQQLDYLTAVVTGVSEGTATITATYKDSSGSMLTATALVMVGTVSSSVAPSSQYSASILENIKITLDKIQKAINDLYR